MRRLLSLMLLLVAMAACHRTTGGPEAGATSSEGAVTQFLNAAKAQDIQAMSAVWGNSESPTRDRMGRQEVERRLIIINCHLRHDDSKIANGVPGEGGRVVHRVELTQGERKASPRFITIKNAKTGRWFVEDFDMTAVNQFCKRSPGDSKAPATH